MVIVAIYFLYGQNRKNGDSSLSGAQPLSKNETAASEIANGQNFIVIRNQTTDQEINRFALPTSTLLVKDIDRGGVNVIEAGEYVINAFPSGKVQSYDLPPGSFLDRWRYSYDGRGEKSGRIFINDQNVNETVMFSPSKKYVSAVWRDNRGVSTIVVYDLAISTVLFTVGINELSEKYILRKVDLWKGNTNSIHWSQTNGMEVLAMELENVTSDCPGCAVNAFVNTNTWEVEKE
jgi:hypothetical protein